MYRNASRITVSIALFMSLSSASAVAQESPWPMFRHDAKHTGATPYTGPASPTLAWTFPTNDGIVSSPTIGTDGTIYFGSGWHFFGADDHNVYALNQDGTLKWSFEGGDGFFSSAALGPNGIIYITSLDGHIYAIEDLETHAELKWKTYLDYLFALSSPVVGDDGTVYVGSPSFRFYALDPDDGSVNWSWGTEWCIISSPAIGDDGTIYIGSKDHRLFAFDDDLEGYIWRFAAGTFYDGHLVDSSPAIGADGTIYFGTDPYGAAGQTPVVVDTNFWAVNPDGSLKWSFDTEDGVESSPAIGPDGTIYFGSYDGYLYAVTDTGSQGVLKWKFLTGGIVDGSPTVDGDGIIYFGSRDAMIYALYPDGSVRWTFETLDGIESSPTIDDNGYLYIGSFDGNLYALGTGAPDVGVTAIDVPQAIAVSEVHVPSATVRNFRGTEAEFDVACVIESEGIVVYSDTIPVSVPGGSGDVAEFAPWQVAGSTGAEYTVTVTATLAGDDNAENDELVVQTAAAPTNRYVSFGTDDTEGNVAYLVEMTASEFFPGSVGVLGWVGEPDEDGVARVADFAHYSNAWPEVVRVGDCEITPAATYEMSATLDGVSFEAPVEVSTVGLPSPKNWGDLVGGFNEGAWAAPDGIVNLGDIQAILQRFSGAAGAPPMTWADLDPEVPNAVVNMTDVQRAVAGFEGEAYPFSDPTDCP